MKSALIGYTGFVGSNLAKQYKFNDFYNSKNIEKIKGKKYDLVVSAGAKADRDEANQNPKEDWKGIKRLINALSETKINKLFLVSTVDVYANKVGVNEDTQIKLKNLKQTYGHNRYKLELFVKRHFPKSTIIRFPNLIGDTLKKNFVYDLIHNSGLELRHKDSLLQYYNLKNIWKDIQIAIKNNLALINFAVEPISAHDIAFYTTGLDFQNITKEPPQLFDFRTKYASLYGSYDEYLYHRKEILKDIKGLVKKEKGKSSR